MAYTIRTYRGSTRVDSYQNARDQAKKQLETMLAAGFGMDKQWVRIENGSDYAKLFLSLPDGTIIESPWFFNF